VTLTRRVILATSAAVALVAVLLSAASYVIIRHELYDRLDATLADRTQQLAPAVRTVHSSRTTSLDVVATPGELVQVLRTYGKSLRPPYQAAVLPDGPRERAVLASGRARDETIDVDGVRMRLLTTPISRLEALQIARPTAEEDSALRRLRLVLVLLGAAALALSLLLGGWIAETALAPVRRLTRAAEDVSETRDLSLRLDAEGRDEVSRLGAAFNRMLGALERSLTAQRNLVADASHEFRTPLTSIRANAELLARGTVADHERDAVLREVVEQVDELDGLVTDVIELALDGEGGLREDDVSLDELVAAEVERMRRHAPTLRFDVTSEPAAVRGDPERLARAVANVLANAAKWSPPGGPVDVTVRDGTVSVRDHGPGFAAEDLPHVFERFYRSPAARGMPGSGLGLAIVRHVVESHGGTVEAANADGGGAVITLRLK
jgi:two-component system sensor histidine kinase MprB